MVSTPVRGLKDEIRDELARIGKTTTRPDPIEHAVRINNHI